MGNDVAGFRERIVRVRRGAMFLAGAMAVSVSASEDDVAAKLAERFLSDIAERPLPGVVVESDGASASEGESGEGIAQSDAVVGAMDEDVEVAADGSDGVEPESDLPPPPSPPALDEDGLAETRALGAALAAEDAEAAEGDAAGVALPEGVAERARAADASPGLDAVGLPDPQVEAAERVAEERRLEALMAGSLAVRQMPSAGEGGLVGASVVRRTVLLEDVQSISDADKIIASLGGLAENPLSARILLTALNVDPVLVEVMESLGKGVDADERAEREKAREEELLALRSEVEVLRDHLLERAERSEEEAAALAARLARARAELAEREGPGGAGEAVAERREPRVRGARTDPGRVTFQLDGDYRTAWQGESFTLRDDLIGETRTFDLLEVRSERQTDQSMSFVVRWRETGENGGDVQETVWPG